MPIRNSWVQVPRFLWHFESSLRWYNRRNFTKINDYLFLYFRRRLLFSLRNSWQNAVQWTEVLTRYFRRTAVELFWSSGYNGKSESSLCQNEAMTTEIVMAAKASDRSAITNREATNQLTFPTRPWICNCTHSKSRIHDGKTDVGIESGRSFARLNSSQNTNERWILGASRCFSQKKIWLSVMEYWGGVSGAEWNEQRTGSPSASRFEKRVTEANYNIGRGCRDSQKDVRSLDRLMNDRPLEICL
jgi:hypothetical protein